VSDADAQNVVVTLWDADVLKDDLIGTGKLNMLPYRNKRTPITLPVFDSKGKEQGKLELNGLLGEAEGGSGGGGGGGEEGLEEGEGALSKEPKEAEKPTEKALAAAPVAVAVAKEAAPGPALTGEKNRLIIGVINGRVYHKQDIIQKADPYVRIKVGKEEKRTQMCKNTLEPQWNDGFIFMYYIIFD
jgi:hypothetical protein